MTGFHADTEGDWVAELSCGHNQHVRHRPPFQLRPWVLDEGGRAGRLGAPLDCPLCDRAEMPESVRFVRSTPVWDELTMPAGLRRAHRVAGGTWGRLVVEEGSVRFTARTEPPIDAVVVPGNGQPIPPDVEHEAHPVGRSRFRVEFLAVSRERAPEGGDPACWAHMVCPECGSVLEGGSGHKDGCTAAGRG